MGLQTDIAVKLRARQTGTNDYGPQDWSPDMELAISLASGVAAYQADLLYLDERTVAASTNDDIDLNGVLVGPFGATISNAEMVAVLVINKPKSATAAANVSSLTIGAATNPFIGFVGGTTPTIGPIRPGGLFLIASPDAAGIGTVVPSTGDILRVANGAGGSATYQIALLGRTA